MANTQIQSKQIADNLSDKLNYTTGKAYIQENS